MKNAIVPVIMANILDKKIIVITGASRGLGRALAEKLGAPDNILVLCAKDIKNLNNVCAKLKKRNIQCYAFKVDVSKKSEITKFIKNVIKRFYKIDILVNNAGVIHKKRLIEKITDNEYKLCLRTNLDSVFYALKEIIPGIKKRKNGTIITISSTAGKRGNPAFAAYSTSKFAVTGLMQSTARYLGEYGIRCITILPAAMNTAMRKYILGASDASKQQSPESVAQIIKKVFENKTKFPNGSEVEIRDGKIVA